MSFHSVIRRLCGFMIVCIAIPLHAQDDSLPPRSEWHATASGSEIPALAPKFAIDDDPATKWGGAFSAGHWLQVDLGRAAHIGGLLLQWDLAFATSYAIQSSLDGEQWHAVYETSDSPGTSDFVFFAPVRARFLRLVSLPRTAEWGVNVYELVPITGAAVPRVAGLGAISTVSGIWTPGSPQALTRRGASKGTHEVRIELPEARPLAGLEVYWGAARSGATLDARDEHGAWQRLAADPESVGKLSFLAASTAHSVRELKLTVSDAADAAPAIRRLRFIGPARAMTPLKRYEIAADRTNRELFPASLHHEQVYWTVVGIPAGKQKSIFDEYGHLEAFKGAPLVQAIWRDDRGLAAAAKNRGLVHSLRDRWKPMPAVEWTPQPNVRIRSEAFALEHGGQPVTLVRHRVRNVGPERVTGRIAVLVRPMQINPVWQNGGLASIRNIAIEGGDADTSVRVNGGTLLHSLTAVDARGAAPFGEHGETEISRFAATGTVPNVLTAQDDDGLAAAMLSYEVRLGPGEQRDIVLALPLGTERIDTTAAVVPDVPPIDRAALSGSNADASYDALANQVAREWDARFGKIGLTLPDQTLVDMLRAQAAYMLLNQSGHAMQPGPRNYNRSFIRDGSATAAILVRMGQPQIARDYLRWYAQHAVHPNGLVSPILNDDGSVNRGFGSDIEYDAQGEFIWLVAEIARLDGGATTVREYASHVKLALKFLVELRERTLVPGYFADRPAPERFRGILAPSISHEGYSTPTHSYWDDYWALKGWHDGAWLAEQWGDRETAKWARAQYETLRESVRASIRATMAWRGSDFIPADADTGNGDPTSVSIALDPTGQQDLLPRDALERTFERYLAEVRKRDVPDAAFNYTPYELRNTLTFVHLNQPQHAEELLSGFLRHRRPFEWQVFAEVVQSRLRYAIYLGDMPHTWIGAEYARAVFGMLMREDDDALLLLPGVPPSWTAGNGLGLTELPTMFGKLSMTAREEGKTLRVTLQPGLRATTAIHVSWPSRRKPMTVTVDGKRQAQLDRDGIRVARPFRTLVAQWE